MATALSLLVSLLVAAAASAQSSADGGDASARPGPDGGIASARPDPDAGVADGAVVDAGVVAAPEPEPEPLPAEHRPKLDVSVEPSKGLKTGDSFTVTIRATVPEDDDVAVPKDQDFGAFDILDKNVTVEGEKQGKRTFEFRLDMIAFEPGEHDLSPVRLRVVTADGVVGFAETDPIPLEVESVLGNEPNAAPKPASEPVTVMEDDYTLAWVGGGLLGIVLVAIATLLIARWWRRRPKPEPPPPPPRPAWQIAMEKLSALRSEREQAFADGRGVEWVDRLSDALREYLGYHYEFEGLESTTDEVIQRLSKLEPRGRLVAEVSSILGDCDLVKFAKAEPNMDRAIAMLDEAETIVRRSMGVTRPAARKQESETAADTDTDTETETETADASEPASAPAHASETETAAETAAETETGTETAAEDEAERRPPEGGAS